MLLNGESFGESSPAPNTTGLPKSQMDIIDAMRRSFAEKKRADEEKKREKKRKQNMLTNWRRSGTKGGRPKY
jgi:hypothetical protein